MLLCKTLNDQCLWSIPNCFFNKLDLKFCMVDVPIKWDLLWHFNVTCVKSLLSIDGSKKNWWFDNSMFRSGPKFIVLPSTKFCLAWNFVLDKTRITIQIIICCILPDTSIQTLFASPENHVKIWLGILFLSRKKFDC